jgi:antitoxin MazE
MEAASLVVDQDVDVRVAQGRVVIEPVATPSYTLDELLAQMDPATFPDNVESGPPVGNEVW